MKCSCCRKECDELPPTRVCIWCKFAEEDSTPIKIGDFAVIIENRNCHGFPMGTKVKIVREVELESLTYTAINKTGMSYYVQAVDIRRLYPGERR